MRGAYAKFGKSDIMSVRALLLGATCSGMIEGVLGKLG